MNSSSATRRLAVASLIDHHHRRARGMIRGAASARWETTQPWVYLRTYTRADVFSYLQDAAYERRLLSILVRYRARGVQYLLQPQWQRIQHDAQTLNGTRQALRQVETTPAANPATLARAFDPPVPTAAAPARTRAGTAARRQAPPVAVPPGRHR